MKRKHLISTLAAVLVTGILIGAAIAYTMLASSIPMAFDVKSSTPLEWDELGRPESPLYKQVWYNTTGNMIDFNLTNLDSHQAYTIINYIRFNQYNPLADVKGFHLKGAFRYNKSDTSWFSSWEDITFTSGYDGANYFAEGPFGNGLVVEKDDDPGCWIEFQIRFWIRNDAPTGWWKITLETADYYDP